MHVPFIDIHKINARHRAEFEEAFRRVVASGRYILGAETEQFEQVFATWTGSRYCVSVANGLDALRVILRSWMSFGFMAPGDEVIVPENSFIASALAVTESALQVRFADVSSVTYNLTSEMLERAVTSKSRAVMPVHLYGQLADIEGIRALCAERNMLMVEDAAQAHGARIGARGAGSFGDAGAFSFYPSKNLGGLGDAGCVVTDDADLEKRVRALRNYGGLNKYEHDFCGFNSRMSELQAAVLTIKLAHMGADNRRRREIAQRYRAGLANCSVVPPAEPGDPACHVWHLFVVRTTDRASLAAHLKSMNIETLVHYPRTISQQPAYAAAFEYVETPVAHQLQHEVLSLPISPVMSDSEVDYVIEAVNSWTGPSALSHSRRDL